LRKFFVALSVLAIAAVGSAQTVLMMPDSTNNRLVTFSAFDGSVINSNLFALAGGTQIHAMQVGNEIWVSEQIGDRISRWDQNGNSLGAITGGMDNVRGMGLIGNTVYLTNAGTANGAPGAAVLRFDTSGNALGNFLTPNAPSPFGIFAHQGGMLVSSSSANDDIHRYTLAGTSAGTFHNSASLNFAEQMDYATNGDILVAGFTTGGIVRLDPNTGALISTSGPSGLRGIKQLGNGNIMYTTSAGAFVFNTATGGSTQVYAGGGRYIDTLTAVPEPATMAALGLGIAAVLRRRRK
jgi:sugar lactone lactonase YvrE